MIDLYTWSTPNGRKVSIMLEELDLPCTVHAIDIGKGDQFKPEFVAVSPNSKIPAIVDSEGPEGQPYALFESGAILLYLAEKTGRFLSTRPTERFDAIQWLMFQMGGVGPMFGQTHHFLRAAPEPVPYAIARYSKETRRLYAVLDRRLAGRVRRDLPVRRFRLRQDHPAHTRPGWRVHGERLRDGPWDELHHDAEVRAVRLDAGRVLPRLPERR